MERIKHRVAHYWSHRAEGFEQQRLREYESEKKNRWLAEFQKYLPKGRPLRILDVGTGTGFFACILAAEGYETTGIDLTPEMIEHAEHMAAVLGVDARFLIMDAEETDFPDESFDVLVTRNLTWTLPHIARAYREWYRLLKPGGVLINFDADYATALEDEEEHELPENHAHKLVPAYMQAENEAITMEVGAYQQPRPQWDVQLLVEAGFERVLVDMGIYKRIYREIDEFFNPTPIFTIAAYK
ncbi:MAG: class I SAM-dependent methyltransferase [Oscillospiraceae bacterium]|nr:class I SAM-dependent methyltransferase [Oscillospiraceae bacterium]